MGKKPLPCAAAERVAQFCEWFDLEVPKLRRMNGQLIWNDDFHNWMTESGASFDWIVLGDARSMAATARRVYLQEREVMEICRQLDATERSLLLEAIQAAGGKGDDAFQAALNECGDKIRAHRSQKVAA